MAKAKRVALGVVAVIVAIVVIVILSGWELGWYSPAQNGNPTTSTGTPIQHVVVILMENQEVPTIYQQPSEFSYLSSAYGNDTEFYPVCHGSMPDYMSMISGQAFACGNETDPITTHSNLPDIIQSHGDTWGGYFESMPTPCDRTDSGLYLIQHNPFLNFQDIEANVSRCNSHILNSEIFNESVAAGSLPTVSWYVPNDVDDCDISSLVFCSEWLSAFLGPILSSTNPSVQGLVAHTAFVVAFDEGTTDLGYSVGGLINTWCQNQTGSPLSTCGGHSYLTVVSPYSKGTQDTLPTTDYSVASTIEWLFDLGTVGSYDGTANFPSMSSLFSFSAN
jgi:Phosphoesterase family